MESGPGAGRMQLTLREEAPGESGRALMVTKPKAPILQMSRLRTQHRKRLDQGQEDSGGDGNEIPGRRPEGGYLPCPPKASSLQDLSFL